jgi:hypothetical protein
MIDLLFIWEIGVTDCPLAAILGSLYKPQRPVFRKRPGGAQRETEMEQFILLIPNQGAGAATQRIEAVRRILPFCFFNEGTTDSGIACLGYYHEKKDEQRHVGLGPEHVFSSHAADAFGLMAICYEGPDGPQTIDELFERQHQYADATRSEITGY